MAKQIIMLRRQATKHQNDACKVFRNLANASIFDLQSFEITPKSPRKSLKKTTTNILNDPYLPPLTALSTDPLISPPLLSSSSPPSSKTKNQRKISQRRTKKTMTTKSTSHEEVAIPIKPRVNRTGRILKPSRR